MEIKKIILFDWGNVMMNADYGNYNLRDVNSDIAQEAGLVDAALDRLIKGGGLWTLSGKALNEYLSFYMPPGRVSLFKEVWQKYMNRLPWFDDVLGVMDSINSCGFGNIDIGILSVCSELDRSLIKHKAGKYAKYYFLSYSMGLMKPDKRIYPLVETVLDTLPENILYFDDLSSSTRAAAIRGWNAVCTDGRRADFIRERCEQFIGHDLKPNAHFKISTWMGEIHSHSIPGRRKTAVLF